MVLVGQRGQIEDGAGYVDPLVVGKLAADHDPSLRVVGAAALDPEADLAVIQEEVHARGKCREDLGMGQRRPARVPQFVRQVEAEGRGLLQAHVAARETADPELRTLQVKHHPDGTLALPFQLAQDFEEVLVVLVGAVAEVETEYVRSLSEEFGDARLRGTARPQGGHDLGVACASHVGTIGNGLEG